MTKRELILQFVRDFFRPKTPIEIAEHELLEAQLAKMNAETSVEYYVAMVEYNQKRINRLIERLDDMRLSLSPHPQHSALLSRTVSSASVSHVHVPPIQE